MPKAVSYYQAPVKYNDQLYLYSSMKVMEHIEGNNYREIKDNTILHANWISKMTSIYAHTGQLYLLI